jgi:hypothetical protein
VKDFFTADERRMRAAKFKKVRQDREIKSNKKFAFIRAHLRLIFLLKSIQ